MTSYKLLLGVTFAALEDEINRLVSDDSSAELINAFFAQGTGFIGAMKYEGTERERCHRRKFRRLARGLDQKQLQHGACRKFRCWRRWRRTDLCLRQFFPANLPPIMNSVNFTSISLNALGGGMGGMVIAVVVGLIKSRIGET
jgi:hypothetical protein